MKHFSVQNPSPLDQLTVTLSEIGLSPADFELSRLSDLLTWLYPSALRLGLTNYRDISSFTSQLVVPALYLLSPALSSDRQSPMLDFGAGSGAVGLALGCLLPDVEVVLADRRSRVVQFVDLAISHAGLRNCQTLLADLSAPAPAQQESCGTVLVRAYAPTTDALIQARSWVQTGGTVALWHQPPAPDPPELLTRTDTLSTSVPALALTIYRRTA